MKKEFILGIYLVVEIIYFLSYDYISKGDGGIFVPIWIVCVLINSYLLYLTLPHLNIDLKSKSNLVKPVVFIIILLIGGIITNGPIELLVESI
jgi:hypothetical protein